MSRQQSKQSEKKLGSDGRILVRESGTEPLVRVMVEAGEEALCEKYVDEVIDVIVKKATGRTDECAELLDIQEPGMQHRCF